MQIQTGFAQVSGTRLYYEMAGAGQPLVFVHGFSLDTRMWDDQFEAFAQHYQVVRCDLRGFGQSATPASDPYTHLDDLKALLQILKIDSAHIAGFSLGGGIAIDFALTYPEATRSLITIDGTLGGYRWAKDWGGPRATAQSAGVAAAREAWLDDELFIPANELPPVAARLRQMVTTYSGWHWLNRDPGRWLQPPAIERLEQIRAPALAIAGEHDAPDFHNIADILGQRIPSCRKVVVSGAGHLANMEAPEQVNEIVLSFLESINLTKQAP
ncbi:MAG: alpha/beta hydrolase [Chloroflexi bacterium]|nr:alpha/beta hydrolase [Chloroflexota bacterium]